MVYDLFIERHATIDTIRQAPDMSEENPRFDSLVPVPDPKMQMLCK